MTDSSETELTRLALEELQREAVRGQQRSDTMGVTGWVKPKMTPNKRFLKNTLTGAIWQRERDKRTAAGRGGKQASGANTGLTAGGRNLYSSDPLSPGNHERHPKKRGYSRTKEMLDVGGRAEARSKKPKQSARVDKRESPKWERSKSSTSAR